MTWGYFTLPLLNTITYDHLRSVDIINASMKTLRRNFCRFNFLHAYHFFFLFLHKVTNQYCADYALKRIRTPYDLLDSVLVLYWEQMSTQSPKTTLALLPLIRALWDFQLKFWWILSVAGKIKPFRFIDLILFIYFCLNTLIPFGLRFFKIFYFYLWKHFVFKFTNIT